MGLVGNNMRPLLKVIPDWPLREIDVRGNPLGDDAWDLVYALPESIHTVGLAESRLTGQASRALTNLRNLRRLDLSRNRLPGRLVHALHPRWPWLAGLRSLNLNRCGLSGRETLLADACTVLAESRRGLDLRENPIPGAGVRHLLDALTGRPDRARPHRRYAPLRCPRRTRTKYGERVVFAASEVVGL